MPLREVPDNPLLTDLNEVCEVRVENLLALAGSGEEVFYAYLNEHRELDFGQGRLLALRHEDSHYWWTPGDTGTPRVCFLAPLRAFPVTDLLGWTLCSAYPNMDLKTYHLHFIHLSLEGSSPYEESVSG